MHQLTSTARVFVLCAHASSQIRRFIAVLQEKAERSLGEAQRGYPNHLLSDALVLDPLLGCAAGTLQ